jgi:hypothetical protein
MDILTQYIRKAMEMGLIDEWHIWDFTRSPDDHQWVTDTFGPVRYMSPSAGYQTKGSVGPTAAFRTSARIQSDLHLAVIPNGQDRICYEIVVGGWNNTHSALRHVTPADLSTTDRSTDSIVWSRPTPGVLSPSVANQVVLGLDADGVATLRVNGVAVGSWPDMDLAAGATVKVRGGFGADLELCDVRSPVRRYVGNENESIPYWQAYSYYTKRLPEVSDSLFLKCDDDIVYLDLEKLSAFIEFRRENPHYFVVSANVVNNGVCAYFQQAAGSIPWELGHFERPPGGFGGSLWQGPARATQLHDHFLTRPVKQLPLATPVVDWTERQSINFIAWLGRDMIHMSLPKCDDEFALTVGLPTYLGRPTAIFSDFTVSHLSFGPQENGLDIERLISAYADLMHETLAGLERPVKLAIAPDIAA